MSRPGITLSRKLAAMLASVGIATFGMPARNAHGQAAPDAATRAMTDDALRTEMARCNALGLPATTDVACERAYAEHRRRFLTPRAPQSQGRPVEMFPATPPYTGPRTPRESLSPPPQPVR